MIGAEPTGADDVPSISTDQALTTLLESSAPETCHAAWNALAGFSASAWERHKQATTSTASLTGTATHVSSLALSLAHSESETPSLLLYAACLIASGGVEVHMRGALTTPEHLHTMFAACSAASSAVAQALLRRCTLSCVSPSTRSLPYLLPEDDVRQLRALSEGERGTTLLGVELVAALKHALLHHTPYGLDGAARYVMHLEMLSAVMHRRLSWVDILRALSGGSALVRQEVSDRRGPFAPPREDVRRLSEIVALAAGIGPLSTSFLLRHSPLLAPLSTTELREVAICAAENASLALMPHLAALLGECISTAPAPSPFTPLVGQWDMDSGSLAITAMAGLTCADTGETMYRVSASFVAGRAPYRDGLLVPYRGDVEDEGVSDIVEYPATVDCVVPDYCCVLSDDSVFWLFLPEGDVDPVPSSVVVHFHRSRSLVLRSPRAHATLEKNTLHRAPSLRHAQVPEFLADAVASGVRSAHHGDLVVLPKLSPEVLAQFLRRTSITADTLSVCDCGALVGVLLSCFGLSKAEALGLLHLDPFDTATPLPAFNYVGEVCLHTVSPRRDDALQSSWFTWEERRAETPGTLCEAVADAVGAVFPTDPADHPMLLLQMLTHIGDTGWPDGVYSWIGGFDVSPRGQQEALFSMVQQQQDHRHQGHTADYYHAFTVTCGGAVVFLTHPALAAVFYVADSAVSTSDDGEDKTLTISLGFVPSAYTTLFLSKDRRVFQACLEDRIDITLSYISDEAELAVIPASWQLTRIDDSGHEREAHACKVVLAACDRVWRTTQREKGVAILAALQTSLHASVDDWDAAAYIEGLDGEGPLYFLGTPSLEDLSIYLASISQERTATPYLQETLISVATAALSSVLSCDALSGPCGSWGQLLARIDAWACTPIGISGEDRAPELASRILETYLTLRSQLLEVAPIDVNVVSKMHISILSDSDPQCLSAYNSLTSASSSAVAVSASLVESGRYSLVFLVWVAAHKTALTQLGLSAAEDATSEALLASLKEAYEEAQYLCEVFTLLAAWGVEVPKAFVSEVTAIAECADCDPEALLQSNVPCSAASSIPLIELQRTLSTMRASLLGWRSRDTEGERPLFHKDALSSTLLRGIYVNAVPTKVSLAEFIPQVDEICASLGERLALDKRFAEVLGGTLCCVGDFAVEAVALRGCGVEEAVIEALQQAGVPLCVFVKGLEGFRRLPVATSASEGEGFCLAKEFTSSFPHRFGEEALHATTLQNAAAALKTLKEDTSGTTMPSKVTHCIALITQNVAALHLIQTHRQTLSDPLFVDAIAASRDVRHRRVQKLLNALPLLLIFLRASALGEEETLSCKEFWQQLRDTKVDTTSLSQLSAVDVSAALLEAMREATSSGVPKRVSTQVLQFPCKQEVPVLEGDVLTLRLRGGVQGELIDALLDLKSFGHPALVGAAVNVVADGAEAAEVVALLQEAKAALPTLCVAPQTQALLLSSALQAAELTQRGVGMPPVQDMPLLGGTADLHLASLAQFRLSQDAHCGSEGSVLSLCNLGDAAFEISEYPDEVNLSGLRECASACGSYRRALWSYKKRGGSEVVLPMMQRWVVVDAGGEVSAVSQGRQNGVSPVAAGSWLAKGPQGDWRAGRCTVQRCPERTARNLPLLDAPHSGALHESQQAHDTTTTVCVKLSEVNDAPKLHIVDTALLFKAANKYTIWAALGIESGMQLVSVDGAEGSAVELKAKLETLLLTRSAEGSVELGVLSPWRWSAFPCGSVEDAYLSPDQRSVQHTRHDEEAVIAVCGAGDAHTWRIHIRPSYGSKQEDVPFRVGVCCGPHHVWYCNSGLLLDHEGAVYARGPPLALGDTVTFAYNKQKGAVLCHINTVSSTPDAILHVADLARPTPCVHLTSPLCVATIIPGGTGFPTARRTSHTTWNEARIKSVGWEVSPAKPSTISLKGHSSAGRYVAATGHGWMEGPGLHSFSITIETGTPCTDGVYVGLAAPGVFLDKRVFTGSSVFGFVVRPDGAVYDLRSESPVHQGTKLSSSQKRALTHVFTFLVRLSNREPPIIEVYRNGSRVLHTSQIPNYAEDISFTEMLPLVPYAGTKRGDVTFTLTPVACEAAPAVERVHVRGAETNSGVYERDLPTYTNAAGFSICNVRGLGGAAWVLFSPAGVAQAWLPADSSQGVGWAVRPLSTATTLLASTPHGHETYRQEDDRYVCGEKSLTFLPHLHRWALKGDDDDVAFTLSERLCGESCSGGAVCFRPDEVCTWYTGSATDGWTLEHSFAVRAQREGEGEGATQPYTARFSPSAAATSGPAARTLPGLPPELSNAGTVHCLTPLELACWHSILHDTDVAVESATLRAALETASSALDPTLLSWDCADRTSLTLSEVGKRRGEVLQAFLAETTKEKVFAMSPRTALQTAARFENRTLKEPCMDASRLSAADRTLLCLSLLAGSDGTEPLCSDAYLRCTATTSLAEVNVFITSCTTARRLSVIMAYDLLQHDPLHAVLHALKNASVCGLYAVATSGRVREGVPVLDAAACGVTWRKTISEVLISKSRFASIVYFMGGPQSGKSYSIERRVAGGMVVKVHIHSGSALEELVESAQNGLWRAGVSGGGSVVVDVDHDADPNTVNAVLDGLIFFGCIRSHCSVATLQPSRTWSLFVELHNTATHHWRTTSGSPLTLLSCPGLAEQGHLLSFAPSVVDGATEGFKFLRESLPEVFPDDDEDLATRLAGVALCTAMLNEEDPAAAEVSMVRRHRAALYLAQRVKQYTGGVELPTEATLPQRAVVAACLAFESCFYAVGEPAELRIVATKGVVQRVLLNPSENSSGHGVGEIVLHLPLLVAAAIRGAAEERAENVANMRAEDRTCSWESDTSLICALLTDLPPTSLVEVCADEMGVRADVVASCLSSLGFTLTPSRLALLIRVKDDLEFTGTSSLQGAPGSGKTLTLEVASALLAAAAVGSAGDARLVVVDRFRRGESFRHLCPSGESDVEAGLLTAYREKPFEQILRCLAILQRESRTQPLSAVAEGVVGFVVPLLSHNTTSSFFCFYGGVLSARMARVEETLCAQPLSPTALLAALRACFEALFRAGRGCLCTEAVRIAERILHAFAKQHQHDPIWTEVSSALNSDPLADAVSSWLQQRHAMCDALGLGQVFLLQVQKTLLDLGVCEMNDHLLAPRVAVKDMVAVTLEALKRAQRKPFCVFPLQHVVEEGEFGRALKAALSQKPGPSALAIKVDKTMPTSVAQLCKAEVPAGMHIGIIGAEHEAAVRFNEISATNENIEMVSELLRSNQSVRAMGLMGHRVSYLREVLLRATGSYRALTLRVCSIRTVRRILTVVDYFCRKLLSVVGSEVYFMSTALGSAVDEDDEGFSCVHDALLIAIGVVLYFGVDTTTGRKTFAQALPAPFKPCLTGAVDATITPTAFLTPDDVHVTQGLKCAAFMCLVSWETNIPLVLTGPPGASKSTAVEMLLDNLQREPRSAHWAQFTSVPGVLPFVLTKLPGDKVGADRRLDSFVQACRRESVVPGTVTPIVIEVQAARPHCEQLRWELQRFCEDASSDVSGPFVLIAEDTSVLDANLTDRCLMCSTDMPSADELKQVCHALCSCAAPSAPIDTLCTTFRAAQGDVAVSPPATLRSLYTAVTELQAQRWAPEAVNSVVSRNFSGAGEHMAGTEEVMEVLWNSLAENRLRPTCVVEAVPGVVELVCGAWAGDAVTLSSSPLSCTSVPQCGNVAVTLTPSTAAQKGTFVHIPLASLAHTPGSILSRVEAIIVRPSDLLNHITARLQPDARTTLEALHSRIASLVQTLDPSGKGVASENHAETVASLVGTMVVGEQTGFVLREAAALPLDERVERDVVLRCSGFFNEEHPDCTYFRRLCLRLLQVANPAAILAKQDALLQIAPGILHAYLHCMDQWDCFGFFKWRGSCGGRSLIYTPSREGAQEALTAAGVRMIVVEGETLSFSGDWTCVAEAPLAVVLKCVVPGAEWEFIRRLEAHEVLQSFDVFRASSLLLVACTAHTTPLFGTSWEPFTIDCTAAPLGLNLSRYAHPSIAANNLHTVHGTTTACTYHSEIEWVDVVPFVEAAVSRVVSAKRQVGVAPNGEGEWGDLRRDDVVGGLEDVCRGLVDAKVFVGCVVDEVLRVLQMRCCAVVRRALMLVLRERSAGVAERWDIVQELAPQDHGTGLPRALLSAEEEVKVNALRVVVQLLLAHRSASTLTAPTTPGVAAFTETLLETHLTHLYRGVSFAQMRSMQSVDPVLPPLILPSLQPYLAGVASVVERVEAGVDVEGGNVALGVLRGQVAKVVERLKGVGVVGSLAAAVRAAEVLQCGEVHALLLRECVRRQAAFHPHPAITAAFVDVIARVLTHLADALSINLQNCLNIIAFTLCTKDLTSRLILSLLPLASVHLLSPVETVDVTNPFKGGVSVESDVDAVVEYVRTVLCPTWVLLAAGEGARSGDIGDTEEKVQHAASSVLRREAQLGTLALRLLRIATTLPWGAAPWKSFLQAAAGLLFRLWGCGAAELDEGWETFLSEFVCGEWMADGGSPAVAVGLVAMPSGASRTALMKAAVQALGVSESVSRTVAARVFVAVLGAPGGGAAESAAQFCSLASYACSAAPTSCTSPTSPIATLFSVLQEAASLEDPDTPDTASKARSPRRPSRSKGRHWVCGLHDALADLLMGKDAELLTDTTHTVTLAMLYISLKEQSAGVAGTAGSVHEMFISAAMKALRTAFICSLAVSLSRSAEVSRAAWQPQLREPSCVDMLIAHGLTTDLRGEEAVRYAAHDLFEPEAFVCPEKGTDADRHLIHHPPDADKEANQMLFLEVCETGLGVSEGMGLKALLEHLQNQVEGVDTTQPLVRICGESVRHKCNNAAALKIRHGDLSFSHDLASPLHEPFQSILSVLRHSDNAKSPEAAVLLVRKRVDTLAANRQLADVRLLLFYAAFKGFLGESTAHTFAAELSHDDVLLDSLELSEKQSRVLHLALDSAAVLDADTASLGIVRMLRGGFENSEWVEIVCAGMCLACAEPDTLLGSLYLDVDRQKGHFLPGDKTGAALVRGGAYKIDCVTQLDESGNITSYARGQPVMSTGSCYLLWGVEFGALAMQLLLFPDSFETMWEWVLSPTLHERRFGYHAGLSDTHFCTQQLTERSVAYHYHMGSHTGLNVDEAQRMYALLLEHISQGHREDVLGDLLRPVSTSREQAILVEMEVEKVWRRHTVDERNTLSHIENDSCYTLKLIAAHKGRVKLSPQRLLPRTSAVRRMIEQRTAQLPVLRMATQDRHKSSLLGPLLLSVMSFADTVHRHLSNVVPAVGAGGAASTYEAVMPLLQRHAPAAAEQAAETLKRVKRLWNSFMTNVGPIDFECQEGGINVYMEEDEGDGGGKSKGSADDVSGTLGFWVRLPNTDAFHKNLIVAAVASLTDKVCTHP